MKEGHLGICSNLNIQDRICCLQQHERGSSCCSSFLKLKVRIRMLRSLGRVVGMQTRGYSAGFQEGQQCLRAEEETLEFSFGVVLGSFSVQSDGRY